MLKIRPFSITQTLPSQSHTPSFPFPIPSPFYISFSPFLSLPPPPPLPLPHPLPHLDPPPKNRRIHPLGEPAPQLHRIIHARHLLNRFPRAAPPPINIRVNLVEPEIIRFPEADGFVVSVRHEDSRQGNGVGMDGGGVAVDDLCGGTNVNGYSLWKTPMGEMGCGEKRVHHGPEKPYAEPNNRDSP